MLSQDYKEKVELQDRKQELLRQQEVVEQENKLPVIILSVVTDYVYCLIYILKRGLIIALVISII
ncbi:Uncharacterised protein [Citrobacter werkmanii]|nr:Uncharacterised protein [Citrobacter werkmanii]